MNRWYARLTREGGFAPTQSVLVIAVGCTVMAGLLAMWGDVVRPALRGAVDLHLVTAEAGSTSPPGNGLRTDVVEPEDPETRAEELDVPGLKNQEKKFARDRGAGEPRREKGNHRPHHAAPVSESDDDRKRREKNGLRELEGRLRGP